MRETCTSGSVGGRRGQPHRPTRHPSDSFNMHDTLAEAYMNRGDRELAIKNYEKALELDPKRFGTEAALAKLKAGK